MHNRPRIHYFLNYVNCCYQRFNERIDLQVMVLVLPCSIKIIDWKKLFEKVLNNYFNIPNLRFMPSIVLISPTCEWVIWSLPDKKNPIFLAVCKILIDRLISRYPINKKSIIKCNIAFKCSFLVIEGRGIEFQLGEQYWQGSHWFVAIYSKSLK